MNWVIPWTTDQVIDLMFLTAAALIALAVPLVYGLRANLRDPLARAVVVGTGATAVALLASVFTTLIIHAGWAPRQETLHWVARGLYAAVGFGKLVLLTALLSALREQARRLRVSDGFQKRAEDAEAEA